MLPCTLAARNQRGRKAAGWKSRVFECRNGKDSTQTAPSAPAGGERTARAPPARVFALQPGVSEPFGEPLPPAARGKVSVELPRGPENPKRSRETNSTAPNPRQGRASARPELISPPREPQRALDSLSRGARIVKSTKRPLVAVANTIDVPMELVGALVASARCQCHPAATMGPL